MVNKCTAYGCTTGYIRKNKEDNDGSIATFHFPTKKDELLDKWKQFVGKKDWSPTNASVLCEKHFKEKFLKRGKRTTLKWDLNPVPTIQDEETKKRPADFPEVHEIRKPPKIRNILPDQIKDFYSQDKIRAYEDIDPVRHCPQGYEAKKHESSILFYRTVFEETTGFPSISAAILIDHQLHVKLQCDGLPVPLPKWFSESRNAKLDRFSMLSNFPAYLANHAEQHPSEIMEELRRRQNCRRTPFSPELIRYSLLLRYTSPQTYRLLLEKFPLPSFSMLKKLHQGGVHSMTAAKTLLDKGSISADVILMSDEMYLQKSSQYHGGEYIGADSNGDLFSGINVFMIVGLQKSVPIVVRASPETKINGESLQSFNFNIQSKAMLRVYVKLFS